MSYEKLLQDLAEKDPALVVMTAENRAAIRNLPPVLGDRFIDVGICEQTMIGAAAGLALRGRVPVCHALATFLVLRAYEFIRTDVGIPGLPVKLVGAVPGFLSDGNGPTHQALEDIGVLRSIPGMTIVCPSDEEELLAAMPAVIASPGPAYVRYNAMKPSVAHSTPFELGKAEVLCEGNDVSILTYGFLVREAMAAKDQLAARGVSARVVDMRTLAPVDERAILRCAKESRLLVTVEDHFKIGGLYSIVAETLLAHETTRRTLPIALDGRWFKPALLDDVLRHEGFTGAQLADRILKVLQP